MNSVTNNTSCKLLKKMKVRVLLLHCTGYSRFSIKFFFQYSFFSQLTVLDTVTTPQIDIYSLFLRKCFRSKYELFWNTLDQTCFENFANHFTDQELLSFLSKTENVHSKYLNLLQIKTEFVSQSEFSPDMITRAMISDRPVDQNIDDIRLNFSMITQRICAQKSKQKISTGIQHQTQTTSVTLNPNMNNCGTTQVYLLLKLLRSPFQRIILWSPVLKYHCKLL